MRIKMYCIWGILLTWAVKPQRFRNWSGLCGCIFKPSPLRCFAQLPAWWACLPLCKTDCKMRVLLKGFCPYQQHQQWGKKLGMCWTLGLTPFFTLAVVRAGDLLLPALACCCRPSLNLQGCSELSVPPDAPYDPKGSCLPCPVLVQPCLHESNSGTTIINIMPSEKMSYLFS